MLFVSFLFFVALDIITVSSLRTQYRFPQDLLSFTAAFFLFFILPLESFRLLEVSHSLIAIPAILFIAARIFFCRKGISVWPLLLGALTILLVLSTYFVLQVESKVALRELHSPFEFVWQQADQRRYSAETCFLLGGGISSKAKYWMGTSLYLAPAITRLWTPSVDCQDLRFVQLLNVALLPLTLWLLVLSFRNIVCIGQKLLGCKHAGLIAAITLFGTALLYLLYIPDWMNSRNHVLGMRRLFGLVFAPESISLFCMSYLGLVLTRMKGCVSSKFEWFSFGLACAILLLLTERNVPIVACFGAILFLLRQEFRSRNFIYFVLGCLLFSVQLAASYKQYGTFYGGNRAHFWESAKRSAVWAPVAKRIYPNIHLATLPQISHLYIKDNVKRFLWWTILPAGALVVLNLIRQLFRRYKGESMLYPELFLFCVGVLFLQLLVSVMYINPSVTFRYNFPLLLVYPVLVYLLFSRHSSGFQQATN